MSKPIFFFVDKSTDDLCYMTREPYTGWSHVTRICDDPGNLCPKPLGSVSSTVMFGCLYLVYINKSDGHLRWSMYDGYKWAGDVDIHIQDGQPIIAQQPPSLKSFQGELYLFLYPKDESKVEYFKYDGMKWTENSLYGGRHLDRNESFLSGVTLCTYKDNLYAFYLISDYILGDTESHFLAYAHFDGENWNHPPSFINIEGPDLEPFGDGVLASKPPQALVYNDKMYVAWTSHEILGAELESLEMGEFDGHIWKRIEIPQPNEQFNITSKMRIWLADDKLHVSTREKRPYQDFNDFEYLFDGQEWSCIEDKQPFLIPHSSELYHKQTLFQQQVPAANVLETPVLPRMHARWMRTIPDNTPINRINIAGTHDSAAVAWYWPFDMYSCQSQNIKKQLNSGIRALDIRLKVLAEGENFKFITCHGSIGSGSHLNEYEPFIDLHKTCTDFLTANPSEFIAMILKVDDWTDLNGEQKVQSLIALGLLFSEANTYRGDSLPVLEEVRGKIYLMNRIESAPAQLGVPLHWDDNTEGQISRSFVGRRMFEVYVQDKYSGFSYSGARSEKFAFVKGAFSEYTDGRLLINFASGIQQQIFGVFINDMILREIGEHSVATRINSIGLSQKGWLFLDYALQNFHTKPYGYLSVVDLFIDSNFSVSHYPKTFKVAWDDMI